jgi:hypothetical protein
MHLYQAFRIAPISVKFVCGIDEGFFPAKIGFHFDLMLSLRRRFPSNLPTASVRRKLKPGKSSNLACTCPNFCAFRRTEIVGNVPMLLHGP